MPETDLQTEVAELTRKLEKQDRDWREAVLGDRFPIHEFEIILAYMPPHPGLGTRPKVVVRHKECDSFLRHSRGPRQGFFWDVYGDDFQTEQLAIIALSQAEPCWHPGRGVHFEIPPDMGTTVRTTVKGA